MSEAKRWTARDTRAATPRPKIDLTNCHGQLYMDVVGDSRGSSNDENGHFSEGEYSKIYDDPSQKVDLNDSMTPLHHLNEMQAATIAILKTGLDQISWEPLISLLQDLADTGTVSRQKLHSCSKQVISKILGSDLEVQVLQQFDEDPRQGEIIMIESLIFSYVQALSNKISAANRQKEPKSSFPTNQKKRKPFSKEKKGPLPSYQKTTESFRRKQRTKQSDSPPKQTQKRYVRHVKRQENRMQPAQEKVQNKVKFSPSTRKTHPSVYQESIINASGDQSNSVLQRNEHVDVVHQKHHTTLSGDVHYDNKQVSKHAAHRKGKKSTQEQDWDQVETETAIKTYEAINTNIKKNTTFGKLPESIENPVQTIEFTPSAKIAFNLYNCNSDTYFDHNFDEKYKETDSTINEQSELYIEDEIQPEKDNATCSNPREDIAKISKTEKFEDLVKKDNGHQHAFFSVDDIGLSQLNHEDENPNEFQKECQINSLIDFTETDDKQAEIIKVNADKERPTYSNKMTYTNIQEPPVTKECLQLSTDFAPTVLIENCQKKSPSCDNLIALRISEELMEILKERFTMRKRHDELALEYHKPTDDNVKLPYSEFEKIRTDNGVIMKRLNMISMLSILVLISSIITSATFLFASGNGYFQKKTIDFFQQLICGWCR